MLIAAFLVTYAAIASAQNPRDLAIATATQDKTPRVALVLASFAGSQDHDGTRIRGLAKPLPSQTRPAAGHMAAMVRKALEIGVPRTGGLGEIVREDDWVMLLLGPGAPPDVVEAVARYLVMEARRGGRITVAGPGWKTSLIARRDGVRIESVDLDTEETIEAPQPNGERVYAVSKTLQQCDRVITIARLAGDLTFGAYARAARKLSSGPEALAGVFSFHPADYSILAGDTLVIAGAGAVAVDAVGAVVLGRDPAGIGHLAHAARLGFGPTDTDLIWTRGNEIEEARKALAGAR